MAKDKNTQVIVRAATVKITKGQIDQARAHGITHANFTNKGVQKRLMKNQERIRREQERRENATKKLNKALDRARKEGELPATARFVDKEGNQIPKQPTDFVYDTTSKIITNISAGSDVDSTTSIKSTHLVAEMPLSPPHRIMDGFSNGIEPMREINLKTEPNQHFEAVGNIPSLNPWELAPDSPRKQMFGGYAQGRVRCPDNFKIPELKPNQAFVNVYGNKFTYQPLPDIGDFIRADSILYAIRTFEEGKVPSEEELKQLCEINFMEDTVGYYANSLGDAPLVEFIQTNKLSLHNPTALSMLTTTFSATNSITDEEGIALTQEQINDHFHHHSKEDDPFCHAKFTVGEDGYKVQNSSLSGTCISPAYEKSFRGAKMDYQSPLYSPTAHATLTATGRSESGYSSIRDQVPDIDIAATYPGPETTKEELRAAVRASHQFDPVLLSVMTDSRAAAKNLLLDQNNLCPEIPDSNQTPEDLEKAAAWSKERCEIYDREMARRNSEKENKEDDGGAGDNSFGLNS